MSSTSLANEESGREVDLLESLVGEALHKLCALSPFPLRELIVRLKHDTAKTTVELLLIPDVQQRAENAVGYATKWTQCEWSDDRQGDDRLVDVGSVAFQPASRVGKDDKAIQLGYTRL